MALEDLGWFFCTRVLCGEGSAISKEEPSLLMRMSVNPCTSKVGSYRHAYFCFWFPFRSCRACPVVCALSESVGQYVCAIRQKTFPKVVLRCKLRCNSSYTAATAEMECAALPQIWWCSECLYKLVQLFLEFLCSMQTVFERLDIYDSHNWIRSNTINTLSLQWKGSCEWKWKGSCEKPYLTLTRTVGLVLCCWSQN